MKDRLEELRAQKQLLQNHLDWLEAEIAREEIHRGSLSATDTPSPAQSEPRAHSATTAASRAAAATPETAPAEPPEVDHKALKHEVRRGCLIYLAIFFAVGLALAGVVYLLYRG